MQRDRWRFVAGPLATITPMVSLLRYESYPLASTEVALVLFGLGLLGMLLGSGLGSARRVTRAVTGGLLVALFVDFQFYGEITAPGTASMVFGGAALLGWLLHQHLSLILATVLGSFLVSALVIPVETARIHEATADSPVPRNDELPIVLHVVFDEWVGIDGVPLEVQGGPSMQHDLEAFFVDRGFRVYPRAFSAYHNTKTSLSQLLNFRGDYEEGLAERGEGGFEWRVLKNAYFDAMSRRGYRSSVIQSSYLDFCESGATHPGSCRTYPSWTLGFVAEQEFGAFSKARMFARLYPLYSSTYRTLRKNYAKFRSSNELELPEWEWELFRPPSVTSLYELERLAVEVSHANRGDFFFAHILLPHSPFAMNADCSIREPSQWFDHKSRSRPKGRVNTPETRALRFQAHFEQVRCTLALFDRVLAGLDANPDARDAVVVVHGDHGARISIHGPRSRNLDQLTSDDLVGTFSTVFAVRAPHVVPGAPKVMRSIQDLFASSFASNFEGTLESLFEQRPPIVYLTKSRKRVVASVPMPAFGRAPEPDSSNTE